MVRATELAPAARPKAKYHTMMSKRFVTALLPVLGAAAAASIGLSAPASAMPQGCTNLSGGSGSPNNGTFPGGTGTGAGAGNTTGGMIGRGSADLRSCAGGAARDEIQSTDNHSGNIGGFAGGGVPWHAH